MESPHHIITNSILVTGPQIDLWYKLLSEIAITHTGKSNDEINVLFPGWLSLYEQTYWLQEYKKIKTEPIILGSV